MCMVYINYTYILSVIYKKNKVPSSDLFIDAYVYAVDR